MKYSRLWVLTAIIAFAILVGFVFSVPHTRDSIKSVEQNVATSAPVVTLHDSFKKGVHTITGSLIAPNACTNASVEVSLAGEGSESGILVALTLTDDGGICLQVPTREIFSATVAAPVDLPIFATVNGATATTTTS